MSNRLKCSISRKEKGRTREREAAQFPNLPQPVYRPGIIRTNSRICIPELCLKKLPTGVVKAASVLAIESCLAAQLGFWTGSVPIFR